MPPARDAHAKATGVEDRIPCLDCDAMSTQKVDVVIVGGGHNGLTAAAYLAGAGLAVTVLERLDEWGGAAVSQHTFEGVEAQLSRYSYLVSLLPEKIIKDLSLPISLATRRYSSYTPVPGNTNGLLIDNADSNHTRESFERIGASEDFEAWGRFYHETGALARALFPGVTDPLLTRSEAKARVVSVTGDSAVWDRFIENPIGETIQTTFRNDLVRGVVLTDALIGTFAPNIDAELEANKCFLYHVIGGGTGDWNVPIGGMGAVSGAIAQAARTAGATLISRAAVSEISEDKVVSYSHNGEFHTLAARYVLVNASPHELDILRGRTPQAPVPEGSQVKVNMVLSRLPRLKDSSLSPEAAFGGTFHINETWSQLEAGFALAESGSLPGPLPCEIYCHSLTDPSILSQELRESGAHTLTVFGLHVPHRVTRMMSNDALRSTLHEAVLASVNSVIAEPLEDVLMRDAHGELCIETKTTQDLEDALGLPGGNIFHGPLAWPFVEDDEDLSTPEKRWGVATRDDGIMLCGSGARRGGAVSGIAGHNAAMAVLEREGR
jgi:phytoene dehydrogenase-like protein